MADDVASDGRIVPFPPPPREQVSKEERARRVMVEATRLANLSPGEWRLWIDGSADQLNVARSELENLVKEILKSREKESKERKAEERRREKRVATQRAAAEKRAEQEKRRAEKEAEHERRKAEKEAERKAKERAKAFGNLAQLPVARHEGGLAKLAKRLGEDVAALREELSEYLGIGSGDAISTEKVEPWPEPVDTATLLQECSNKLCRYVVLRDHHQITGVLWEAHAWLYDYGVPTHSPILSATSAEPDSGKSTLVVCIGLMAPRFSLNIEMTGPSLYRFVDAVKPTLVIDEADDLFSRKSDLKHIINASWTRGAKIPRQVNISGVWATVAFDPFCPKAIALLGHNLPSATRTRCIELRMVPKRPDEKVEPFNQLDDAEFAILRRKFARWAADNATALKNAKPVMPAGMNNRVAENWRLLLAIAELAGGAWPQRAREAARRLGRSGRQPSDGIRLLAAIKTMFANGNRKVIASKKIAAELVKDPTDIWVAYNHGGAVTQRQIAYLLSAYEITPDTVHPTGHSADSPKGYKLEQFADAFARYLPGNPHIRTEPNKSSAERKPQKTCKRRRK